MILNIIFLASVSAASYLDQNSGEVHQPEYLQSATYNATEVERCLDGQVEKIRYWSAGTGTVLISINFDNDDPYCWWIFDCLRQQNPNYRVPLVDHAYAERDATFTEAVIGRDGLVTLYGEVPLAKRGASDSGNDSPRWSTDVSSEFTLSEQASDMPAPEIGTPRRLTMLLAPLMRWFHGAPTLKRSQS